jgi:predicted CXXCH cytochrome family protein
MLPAVGDALCVSCHDDVQALAESSKYKHEALDEGCGGCHDPHGTGVVRMLMTEAETFCYSCHEDKEEEILAYKFQHEPVASGECWSCHAPHGSDTIALLKGNYPDTFYAPYTEEAYSLCLSCHERGLLAYGRTSEATDFRNGDKNLHYVHVNKTKKGRTCRVCHGVHGENQERLVHNSKNFGRWQIPVELTWTENGGGCLVGCHKPLSYSRKRAVKN